MPDRHFERRSSMAFSFKTLVERRGEQVHPRLDPVEIERVRYLGETRNFTAGETLQRRQRDKNNHYINSLYSG